MTNPNPKLRKHNCVIARLEKGLRPLDKCPVCGKRGKKQKLDKKKIGELATQMNQPKLRKELEEFLNEKKKGK